MVNIKILELFGGIGACSKALKNIGIDFEIVDYVEIDKFAVNSYNALNNTNFTTQDIRNWDKDISVDLIMHGSPCQDFSTNGKNLGGDENSGTRSSLMYESIRIINKLKPKFVIWENVKNVLSKRHIHNFENYLHKLNEIGYTNYYKILNAKNYGIPQNRERVFVVSILDECEFHFPKEKELTTKLIDLLEDVVPESYFLSDERLEKVITGHNKDVFYIKNNTKTGFLEGRNGDGCYISNISKTKRGTVQKDMLPTLKTTPDVGVIVDVGDSILLNFPNTKKNRITKEVLSTLLTGAEVGVFVN